MSRSANESYQPRSGSRKRVKSATHSPSRKKTKKPSSSTRYRRGTSSSTTSRRRPPRLRRIVEGCTYLVTKKTNDDLFWLKPSDGVNLVLLYTLLLKAEKYGIWLHAFCFMSNHFHMVVTDPRGELPAFMREFLGETGKALKIEIKTSRRIWNVNRYSATELLDLDAAERKIAYTLLNPLEAGLTQPEDWPGLSSARFSFGSTLTAERPDFFFSKRYRPHKASTILEPLPEEIVNSVSESVRPKEKSPHAKNPHQAVKCQKRIAHRMRVASKKIRETQANRGKWLSGRAVVLTAKRAARGSPPFGGLNPRFASKDHALLKRAIESLHAFEREHAAAKDRYAEGEQRTLFPRGTYGYRRVLSVRVAHTPKGGRAA